MAWDLATVATGVGLLGTVGAGVVAAVKRLVGRPTIQEPDGGREVHVRRVLEAATALAGTASRTVAHRCLPGADLHRLDRPSSQDAT